jgi:hypothetical protein
MLAALPSVVALIAKSEEAMSQLIILFPEPSHLSLSLLFLGNQSLETTVDLLDFFD